MNATMIHSRSGPDAKLRLEIPVDRADAEFEVEVVVRPKGDENGWPPGYFDLFGSVDDDSFVRPPQGELPPAAEIE
mgnify:CR=1 FL=1